MLPHPLLSVPFTTGIVEGVGIADGCAALLWLKYWASAAASFAQMTTKDYGLLTGLEFLSLTDLATFFSRDTAALGPVLLIHLAAIVASFGSAPNGKFVHLIFRFPALVRDNAEAASERTRTRRCKCRVSSCRTP